MRWELAVVALGAMLAPIGFSYAAATPGDIVTVDADVHGTEETCPAVNASLSCPFSWSSNGTTSPGDDKIESTTFVDAVRVTVRPPGDVISSQQFEVEPSDLVVHHPIYDDLNQTWSVLNESRPMILEPYVSFESRPYPAHCYANDDSKWGIFVIVHPPEPYGSIENCSWVSLVPLCWDPCYLSNESYMQQTNDTLTPFPNGVFLRNYDGNDVSTDDYADSYVLGAENCYSIPQIPCNVSVVSPALNRTDESYHETTPAISEGFQFNRTSLTVKPNDSISPSNFSMNGLGPKFDWQAPPLPSGDKTIRQWPLGEKPLQPKRDPNTNVVRGAQPIPPPRLQSVSNNEPVHSSPTILVVVAGATITFFAFVGWLLYHRLSKREGLQQPTRRRIQELLVATPGLRTAELASKLGLDHATVKYHLKKMVLWGLVRAGPGRRPRFFAVQCLDDPRVAEVLAQPTLRAVHAALKDLGEADHSMLAAAVNVSNAVISRAVTKLEMAGLVTQTRSGRRVIVRPLAPASGVAGCRRAGPTG